MYVCMNMQPFWILDMQLVCARGNAGEYAKDTQASMHTATPKCMHIEAHNIELMHTTSMFPVNITPLKILLAIRMHVHACTIRSVHACILCMNATYKYHMY